MSSSTKLGDLGLGALCARLAERTPTPAGGSTAAAVGALGASVLSMAFRYAASEPGIAIPAYMQARAEELLALRDLLLELVERDAAAYERLRAARRAAEPSAEAVAKATSEVIEAPLETTEHALAALRLFAVGREHVPARLASDAEAGGHALLAAVRGAAAVGRVNLADLAAGDPDLAATLDALVAESEELAHGLGLAAGGAHA
jgi:formiminotetrahydrofolate cyclodeaminase